MRLSLLITAALCTLGAHTPSPAQWSHDPILNNPLCTAAGDQSYPCMVSDGEGGAVVAWTDGRGIDNDIYAQHIGATGATLWTANGLPICLARNDQTAPAIVSDGAGGAIITWTDSRSGNNDIYGQRVSGGGSILWQPGGIPICTAPNDQVASTMVGDGTGGAIVTWRDLRNGTSYDIYAQRISSSGATRWTANGVPVCTAPNRQTDPAIAGDGAAGAIITWLDNRSGKADVYAQRVSGAGEPGWNRNGILISESGSDERNPAIIGDGTGGGIITWRDARNGMNYDIYAERVNGSGSIQWAGNGIPVCTAAGDQESPQIIHDGLRGGIIVWTDNRNENGDIFAQRLDISGNVQWVADGIPVCKAPGNQMYPAITLDGLGGAIIAWLDCRRGEGDIYAQRINGLGSPEWAADGVAVCTSPGEQFNPAIVNATGRCAIIAWYDYRTATNSDIFSQRIDRVGYLGDASPHLAGVESAPGEGERTIRVMWNRSYVDTWPNQTVTSYAIWRGVKLSARERAASLAGGRRAGRETQHRSPARASFAKQSDQWLSWVSSLGTNGEDTIYWEYITSVKPHWLKGYSYTFPLRADADQPRSTQEYFMITALTPDPLVYWDSEIKAGPGAAIPPLPPSQLSGRFAFPSSRLLSQFAFPSFSGRSGKKGSSIPR